MIIPLCLVLWFVKTLRFRLWIISYSSVQQCWDGIFHFYVTALTSLVAASYGLIDITIVPYNIKVSFTFTISSGVFAMLNGALVLLFWSDYFFCRLLFFCSSELQFIIFIQGEVKETVISKLVQAYVFFSMVSFIVTFFFNFLFRNWGKKC